MLATHLPPRQGGGGAWLAFLVQALGAVLAGSVLQLFPVQPVRVAAGLGLLAFAGLALRRNLKQEMEAEQADVLTGRGRRSPPWVASFLVVFAAEWGDLTQLATAGLVAHTGRPLEVGLGALAALGVVSVLAATAGGTGGAHAEPRRAQSGQCGAVYRHWRGHDRLGGVFDVGAWVVQRAAAAGRACTRVGTRWPSFRRPLLTSRPSLASQLSRLLRDAYPRVMPTAAQDQGASQ